MEGMKNEVVEKKESRQMITDYSKGIFGTSDNFLMATQMAKALAQSDIVPKAFQGKWANCLIAIEQANRLKMSPMMVMQNMYVVYGSPSWSSKFLIAMINNSGKYDQPLRFREELKNGKPFACTAWTTQNGEVVEGMTIDMDIAKAEGWVDKNGSKWKTMPQLMLRYRAASFFSNFNCPEITMGIYTQEEVEDSGGFKENLADVIADVQEKALEKIESEPVEIQPPTQEAVEPVQETLATKTGGEPF